MNELRFQSAALLEAESATLYYEERRTTLGEDFKTALREACGRVAEAPLLYSLVEEGCRCCRLKRFPFGIIYVERSDYLEVIAVMHLQRKPGYWLDRL